MALPDLLLGTRRLRREIDAQSRLLRHDVERVKTTTTQLRHATVAAITSPLGLLGAMGAGFVAGRLAGPSRRAQRLSRRAVDHAVGNATAFALATARTIGLQVLLPLLFEWLQTRLSAAGTKVSDTRPDAPTSSQSTSPRA